MTGQKKRMSNMEKKICPKCGGKLVKVENMFYLRKFGSMPGMFCKPCNALYNSNEFEEALKKRAKDFGVTVEELKRAKETYDRIKM